MRSGTESSTLFSIVVHDEVEKRMNVRVHETSHYLECRHFRDLFGVWSLLESRREAEDSNRVGAAKAETLPLLPDGAGLLAIIARNVRAHCLGCIV